MIWETGERIYSNDYADLLLTKYHNESIINRFTNATFRSGSTVASFLYVPVSEITDQTIVQLGYEVMPHLLQLISTPSLEASGITRLRNISGLELRGQGILIGILDTGIDYTHPVFINDDNTTKIACLWDQTIYGENYSTNTPYYGTEYTREQLNEALKSNNPYSIVPSRDEIGHGTMLAGIAAGKESSEYNFSGVVPDAELVVVKLKPAKQYLKQFWLIPDQVICYQENDVISALVYLEQTAIRLNRPMSICLALGTSQGSHDGRSTINTELSLRAEVLNFALTIAAGNEGHSGRHYYGSINPTIGFDTVELNVGEEEGGFTMELWGDTPGLFAIDIISPSGEYIPRVLPRFNEHYDITFIFEKTRISLDYQVIEAQSGDQLILFRFFNPAPGVWRFKVYGKGDLSLSFHIWLPNGAAITNQTYFQRSVPYTTILSYGNALRPLTITAYNTQDNSLYINASKGYTRARRLIKPEIAAPGVNVLSPSPGQGFTEVTGSSPAAAHVAGVAAMLLEWGVVRGNIPLMNTANIKILMIRGAKRYPGIKYPNQDWGYGILDVYNIFYRLSRGV